ncbi:FAD-binding protein [Rhizobium sp. SG2393]|uniref:FAD-binding protein n=1 Tax=Rhizobium sp. SG2393 TaxID=3276279 RepID=UPI0036706318
MPDMLNPTSEAEAAEMIRAAAADGRALAIRGGGTRSMRVAGEGATILSTSGLTGITAYEPAEMTMTARAGTPLAEIEAALAAHRQMLAFEPHDLRPVLGTAGEPTIGGVFATNASGPRRFVAGAARDSLLGVRFVNGSGEAVKSGGRVMKNVTGLDLVKLMAGSRGTLALMSEVTFRLLPVPETAATIVLSGLDDEAAARAMAAAMSLPVEVSGAAHLPESVRGRFLGGHLPEGAATVLRLEGLAASVAVRLEKLTAAMAPFAPVTRLDRDATIALWQEIRDAKPYADGTTRALWRVSAAPMEGQRLIAALRLQAGIDCFYDWQGGLVWMRMEAGPEAALVRGYAEKLPGTAHATLIRADAASLSATPAEHPVSPALEALTTRIRASIDPAGIFSGKAA